MKKAHLLLMLFAVIFSSCDKDVTEVTFNSTITATSDDIVVNDSSLKSTGSPYNIEFDVNLENDETREYLDKIKDIEFENLEVLFNGLETLEGNQTPTNLVITINDNITFQYNDFVYNAVATGNAFSIDDIDKINEVAKLLLENKVITVKVEGEIPDVDFHQFNITVNALAKITADAL